MAVEPADDDDEKPERRGEHAGPAVRGIGHGVFEVPCEQAAVEGERAVGVGHVFEDLHAQGGVEAAALDRERAALAEGRLDVDDERYQEHADFQRVFDDVKAHLTPKVVPVEIPVGDGRDFHGMGYYYLRDYRLNSNDWFLNSISTEPGPENKPKNQFGYPGFNFGGPLLIPGTDFNKNRDKVFFFTGYEYYRQRLDTGTLRSFVPTEAMREILMRQEFNAEIPAGVPAGAEKPAAGTLPPDRSGRRAL